MTTVRAHQLSPEEFWAQGGTGTILAKHGKTFNWARRFLGQGQGDKAARLYAFCRYLDDIADGDVNGGSAALTNIQDMLAQKQAVDDPVVAQFMGFAEVTGIDFAVLDALLDGLIQDQSVVLLDSRRDLLRYAYRVAGTVGLMMCDVLECDDPEAKPFAIDLGIAMQLTNIARDVLADAEMDRRYLPARWCMNLRPIQIRMAGNASETENRLLIQTAMEEILDMAEAYYVSGFQGLAYLSPRAQLAIGVAGQAYREIGEKIRRNGFRFWEGRIVVTPAEKVLRSIDSLSYFKNRFAKTDCHDMSLHADLEGLPYVSNQRA
ncbi:MAG: phytoene/squalene synthase family protein [Parvibaculales bacterium]